MLNNKYIVALSLVLNGILLIFLFGLVPFLLYLSFVLNILFLWLLRKTYKRINESNEDMNNMFDKTSSFLEHLERIYGMEMYYGDQTLQGLIEHSREMGNRRRRGAPDKGRRIWRGVKKEVKIIILLEFIRKLLLNMLPLKIEVFEQHFILI